METPSSSKNKKSTPDPMGWLQQLFAYFRNLTSGKEEDSTLVLGLKVIGRIFLIFLLILLSPLLLVALVVAFFAAF